MTRKQLRKLNRLAHPDRPKADFKGLSKKQLLDDLRCRILYLRGVDALTTPRADQDRFNSACDQAISIMLEDEIHHERDFVPAICIACR